MQLMKLNKLWNVEHFTVPIEEAIMTISYIQVVEKKSINPGHEALQVFAETFELQRGKRGKNCTWRQR